MFKKKQSLKIYEKNNYFYKIIIEKFKKKIFCMKN